MTTQKPPGVPVEPLVAELQEAVRVKLRRAMLEHGASPALGDPAVFGDVDTMLREAVGRTSSRSLLLPEYLGDPDTWRLEPALKLGSHRSALAARVLLGVKRKVLLPVLRWLFEYTHDNFVRQQRVNLVLFAVVQELAARNAELRRDLDQIRKA